MKLWLQTVIILTCILFLSGCFNPPGIRVMSMDMMPKDYSGKVIVWDDLKPITTEFMLHQKPDIIGLQNANRTQLHSLLIDIPGYGYAGDKGPMITGIAAFNPIFYKLDQFEVMARSQFNLSNQPLSDPGLVTWIQLKYLETGHIIFFFNTAFGDTTFHNLENNAMAFLNQIRIIAGNAPVIISANIQNDPGQKIYHIITSAFSDAYPLIDVASTQPKETLSGQNHIFINAYYHVEKYHKMAAPRDGVLVLNNYPIMTELSFNDQPKLKPGDAGRLNNWQPEIRADLWHLLKFR